MPSQHSGTWSKSQSERLVAWMEENQEELRGKQIKWHKLVKEQVFSNDEHITVKRITDKATNMKRSWKEARAMQQRSGWGVKAENNEASINETLERKCAFFWRLDEIWGSRPNVELVGGSESITSRSRMPSKISSEKPSEIPFIIPSEISSQIPAEISSQIPTEIASDEIASQTLAEIPSAIPVKIPSSSSSSSESPPPSVARPPVHSTSRPLGNPSISLPKRSEKHDFSAIIGEKEAGRKKRHKVEMDVKLEIARMKQETAREIARIQADAQIRQMEVFGHMMQGILGTQGLGRWFVGRVPVEERQSKKESEKESVSGIGSDGEVT
ncbi:hypothetical protein EV426DRAFT_599504 [Tirmania nivea]|nr:hypothetical protein EV426DRAFT_599504 [Tirmania nivea]